MRGDDTLECCGQRWLCGLRASLNRGRRQICSVCGCSEHRSVGRGLDALFTRSRSALLTLAAVMSVVQVLDGVIGILADSPAKTYGPFFFAILNFIAMLRLRAERELILAEAV